MEISAGLLLALVSAIAINWAYAREHDAVSAMPPFSARHPLRFALALAANRRWLVGFAAESSGWLVYVAALRLAPIALVQAVGASGIAVLAFASVHGRLDRLARRDLLAVATAVAGLALLGLSLVDTQQVDRVPDVAAVVLWLAAVSGGGLVLALAQLGIGRAPALGLAAGILFAGGDISTKLVGYGGAWLLALVPLVGSYALGTSLLQGGFQHGAALTAAGLATIATNAVPIAAGFSLFGEELPHGAAGALQIAAFASLVVGATLLAGGRERPSPEPSLS